MEQSAKSLFIFGTAIVGGLLSVVIGLGVYALGGIPLHVVLITGALGGGLVGVAAFFVAKDLTKTSPPRAQFNQDAELKDGIIRLSDPLVSDGTTGPEWIDRLTKDGYNLSKWSRKLLQSDDFHPTNGVTYQITILKGELFSDEERTTKNVRDKAGKLGLETPNPEVACLLREKLSDEEMEKMGLTWLITMHEPIEDFGGDPLLLHLNRNGDGRRLGAPVDRPDDRWDPDDGFVLVSQGTTD